MISILKIEPRTLLVIYFNINCRNMKCESAIDKHSLHTNLYRNVNRLLQNAFIEVSYL